MIFNPTHKKGGIVLPTLSNPAVATDLRNGKQLIDQNGQPLTGTMLNVTVNDPSISVNENGLITAQANVSGNGYVTAGAKTKTLQLSSAYDPQFVAANIKKGINIFGVTGTYEGYSIKLVDVDIKFVGLLGSVDIRYLGIDDYGEINNILIRDTDQNQTIQCIWHSMFAITGSTGDASFSLEDYNGVNLEVDSGNIASGVRDGYVFFCGRDPDTYDGFDVTIRFE